MKVHETFVGKLSKKSLGNKLQSAVCTVVNLDDDEISQIYIIDSTDHGQNN